MAVSPTVVRGIVERACARPDVLDACGRRNLGAVISALGTGGLRSAPLSLSGREFFSGGHSGRICASRFIGRCACR